MMRPYYYLGDGQALTHLSNGLPFFVNTRDKGISSWIILGGTWENFVDDILCGITRPGDRILDAGANQGYYSVKLGNIIGPQGQLFAFEPNPELFTILENNISLNGFQDRAVLFQSALGHQSGTATLQFSYINMGGGTITRSQMESEHSVDVAVLRGDDVIPDNVEFDVFKFDIEGSEPNAALGLVNALSRSKKAAIVVEISPKAWSEFGSFDELLLRLTGGFRVGFEIHHDGLMDPLDFATLSSRKGMFYALLLPPDHWAMNFALERCRPNSAGK